MISAGDFRGQDTSLRGERDGPDALRDTESLARMVLDGAVELAARVGVRPYERDTRTYRQLRSESVELRSFDHGRALDLDRLRMLKDDLLDLLLGLRPAVVDVDSLHLLLPT